MRRKTKICPYCEAVFFINKDTQFYCSNIHMKLAWKKRNKEKGNTWQRKRYRELHPLIDEYRKCILCQMSFKINVHGKHRKYCSPSCATKYHLIINPNIKRKRIIWKNKNREKVRLSNLKYKAISRFGVSLETLKKEVIERDKGLCQLCGDKYYLIHHIRYPGTIKDFVCLCNACHTKLHKKFTKPPYWEIS